MAPLVSAMCVGQGELVDEHEELKALRNQEAQCNAVFVEGVQVARCPGGAATERKRRELPD